MKRAKEEGSLEQSDIYEELAKDINEQGFFNKKMTEKELQEKASKVKIDHGASGEKAKTERKIVKKEASDAKKFLFSNILGQLEEVFGENVKVLTENKLITVQIDEKTFKIDVIEKRKPKK